MTERFILDGKRVSLLGYGAMRMPTVDGGHANSFVPGASKREIDQDQFNRQVRRMLEHGVNYFDTSPAYCQGRSEASLGTALAASGFDRDKYIIATKLSNFSPVQFPLAACKDLFEKSLKNLRTDYIDNYLLHSIGNGGMATFRKRFVDNGAVDWCCELRAKKIIRNLGFSFHGDPKTFDWCIENHAKYHWDFAMIQMNYVDWRHASGRNLNAKDLYDRLTAAKIPVVVMEPLLGGKLARYNWAIANELTPLDPEASQASWAFRFVGSHPNVMTAISGMTYTEHIDENIRTFSPLKPLEANEFEALERAAKAMLNLNTVPCTGCNYCMPCPYGLDIPALLDFRNGVISSKQPMRPAAILKRYEEMIPEPLRRADHCTGCDRCVSHCPQSIVIPKEIAAIDQWIDDLKEEYLK